MKKFGRIEIVLTEDTILDELYYARVLSIEIVEGPRVRIEEACDGYYHVDLRREEAQMFVNALQKKINELPRQSPLSP